MATNLSQRPKADRDDRREVGPVDMPRGSRTARASSAFLVGLLAVASGAGLLVRDLYQEPATVAAMFRGYDLTALAIVCPLLVLTSLPGLRRSVRAQLLWVGALAFSVYHSALYVFGMGFNDLFLIHVAMFSVSIFAFAMALSSVDVAGIGRLFSERTPARSMGSILLFLGGALAVFWIVPSLRFAITGELPAEGSALIVPTSTTHLGWALDLSLLVPAYAVAGILLWRRAAWGYVLATIMFVAGFVQQVAYTVALLFQSNADIPGATGFDPFEPAIMSLYLVGATVLLTRIRGDHA